MTLERGDDRRVIQLGGRGAAHHDEIAVRKRCQAMAETLPDEPLEAIAANRAWRAFA
jgi:hypothetical protein